MCYLCRFPIYNIARPSATSIMFGRPTQSQAVISMNIVFRFSCLEHPSLTWHNKLTRCAIIIATLLYTPFFCVVKRRNQSNPVEDSTTYNLLGKTCTAG